MSGYATFDSKVWMNKNYIVSPYHLPVENKKVLLCVNFEWTQEDAYRNGKFNADKQTASENS